MQDTSTVSCSPSVAHRPHGLAALRSMASWAPRLVAMVAVVMAACGQPGSGASSTPGAPTALAPVQATALAPQNRATSVPAPATAVPVPTAAVGAWVPGPRSKTADCLIRGGLPDAACTPGAVDARVTQTDIDTTICTRGYTATVRPPESVTERIKRQQMTAYGLTGQPMSEYELDHLISLELGGSPADVANLWPEPWTGEGNAHQKDAVETYLSHEVCRGVIPLAEAQRQIATNWLAVYRSRGLQPVP